MKNNAQMSFHGQESHLKAPNLVHWNAVEHLWLFPHPPMVHKEMALFLENLNKEDEVVHSVFIGSEEGQKMERTHYYIHIKKRGGSFKGRLVHV